VTRLLTWLSLLSLNFEGSHSIFSNHALHLSLERWEHHRRALTSNVSTKRHDLPCLVPDESEELFKLFRQNNRQTVRRSIRSMEIRSKIHLTLAGW
jgi:hypothetical protein